MTRGQGECEGVGHEHRRRTGGWGRGEAGTTALRTQSQEWAANAAPGARTAPHRGRDFGQGHQLEQAAHGGPADHLGALARAHRRHIDLPCVPAAWRRGKEWTRIAISIHIFLEITPVVAANSASSWRSANAGVPARPNDSWDRERNRHSPVPERPYLSRFNASLASAETPVPQAAAATAEVASGCVTHISTNTGRPRRYGRRSPRRVLRWGRGGSRVVPVAPPECCYGRRCDGHCSTRRSRGIGHIGNVCC